MDKLTEKIFNKLSETYKDYETDIKSSEYENIAMGKSYKIKYNQLEIKNPNGHENIIIMQEGADLEKYDDILISYSYWHTHFMPFKELYSAEDLIKCINKIMEVWDKPQNKGFNLDY